MGIKNIKKFFQNRKIILFIIFLIGIALRFIDVEKRFFFGHDHDLSFWFVLDVLTNKHLRLVGQETSTQGIFIGPIYYYLQIPFFLLLKMNAVAEVYLSSTIGLFGIFSSYYVFLKSKSVRVGLIAAFIYATSFYVIANDREAVPTMPVIIWTIWFYYSLYLLKIKNVKQGFTILGFLIGLIWHLNFALILLLPLILIPLIGSKYKFKLSDLKSPLVITVLLLLPFILFELRHNFIQTVSFMNSLTTNQGSIYSGIEKFVRVVYLMNKNFVSIVWGTSAISEKVWGLGIFLLLVGFLKITKYISRLELFLVFGWVFLYLIFFSVYSKEVSEYYLNGLFGVYLFVIVTFLDYLFTDSRLKFVSLLYLFLFGFTNISVFVREYGGNPKTFYYKNNLAQLIKSDMTKNGYNCASISFITNPGYEFGFRYFFYKNNISLRYANENIPVYSIIFPIGKDGVVADEYSGAYGLIYPDKKSYSLEDLNKKCILGDVNILEPMWGFPK